MASSSVNYMHNLNGKDLKGLILTRFSRNISPSSKMMIALAWVMEVIIIDVTENTTNKTRWMTYFSH